MNLHKLKYEAKLRYGSETDKGRTAKRAIELLEEWQEKTGFSCDNCVNRSERKRKKKECRDYILAKMKEERYSFIESILISMLVQFVVQFVIKVVVNWIVDRFFDNK